MTQKLSDDVVPRPHGKKFFCIKAFGGLSVTPSGSLAPCCLFEKTITREDGTPYSIWKDGIDEAYNSPFMQEFRQKMLRDEPEEACRQCYQVESHGGYSMRIQSNSVSFENPSSISLQDQNPVSLDLKLNNKCNLKCRMCQPRDSHLIYEEFRRIQLEDSTFKFFSNAALTDPDLKIPLDEVPNWAEQSAFKESFRSMLPHLRKIALVGGEPLILDELYDTLDICVEEDHAKDIFLVITSNFMHVPMPRLTPLLNAFKATLFNISLDAVGTELNYIRFPSQFDRIVQNFWKIYQISDLKRVTFQFSPTVQVYNVIYLHQVYHFVEELLKQGVELTEAAVNLTFLEFPVQLNIRILPQNVRTLALSRLNAVIRECPLLMGHPIVLRNLKQLINILETEYLPESERLVSEFLHYSAAIDKQRGQRMQDFLPELSSSFESMLASPPKPSFHFLRERGWELARENKFLEAIVCFEAAYVESTDKYLDLREMAWMKLELRDFAGALTAYEEGVKLNPADPYLAKGLVLTQFATQNDHEFKARLALALSLNPQDDRLREIAATTKLK